MTKITEVFPLVDEKTMEFLNVDVDTDLKFFLDPIMIYLRQKTKIGRDSVNCIESFREEAKTAIKKGDKKKMTELFDDHLHEHNETHIGYSEKKSVGRGLGEINTKDLLMSLKTNKAMISGDIKQIEDLVFAVEGLGPDKLSDMLTNIIKYPLLRFTEKIAEKYRMGTTRKKYEYRNFKRKKREKGQFNLPYHAGTLIFIPKYFVTDYMYLCMEQFYEKGMITDIQNKKNSKINSKWQKSITKDEIKKQHPYSYETMIDYFVKQYPNLNRYKERVKQKLKYYNKYFKHYPKVDGISLPEAEKMIKKYGESM